MRNDDFELSVECHGTPFFFFLLFVGVNLLYEHRLYENACVRTDGEKKKNNN